MLLDILLAVTMIVYNSASCAALHSIFVHHHSSSIPSFASASFSEPKKDILFVATSRRQRGLGNWFGNGRFGSHAARKSVCLRRFLRVSYLAITISDVDLWLCEGFCARNAASNPLYLGFIFEYRCYICKQQRR